MAIKDRDKHKPQEVVLQYGGWIIRRIPHCYTLHHRSDKKMKNAVYPSSLVQAIGLLHEKLLLDKRYRDGYDGSVESFKNALVEVNMEFEGLLSPQTIEFINRKLGVNREDGGAEGKDGG